MQIIDALFEYIIQQSLKVIQFVLITQTKLNIRIYITSKNIRIYFALSSTRNCYTDSIE